MKILRLTKWSSGMMALGAALVFGCESSQHSARPSSVPVTTVIHEPAPAPMQAQTQTPVAPPSVENEVGSDVGLQVLARPPENISPGVREVVKLIRGGVGLDVLLNYIDNSPREYELSADEIIYLRDLGASDEIVQAMMDKSGSFERQAVHLTDPESFDSGEYLELEEVPSEEPIESDPNAEFREQAPAAQQMAAPGPTAEPLPQESAYPVVVPSENARQPMAVEQATAQEAPTVVNNYYFYEALDPYGNWVELPDYGWSWQPSVAVVQYDWKPYHNHGRWLYTDHGWYWKSYYSWGYVPFHYGRWHQHHHHGWVWTPGYTWGPAWVTWRHHRNYVGWAPLPPRSHYQHGVGFHFGGTFVDDNFGFHIGFGLYSFVDHGHFYHDNPWRYHVPYHKNKAIYEDSVVNNNYVHGNDNTIINGGVNITNIQNSGRREIQKLVIRDSSAANNRVIQPERFDRSSSSLAVYRPQVSRHANRPPERIVAQSRLESRKAVAAASGSSLSSRSRTAASRSISPSDARASSSSRAALSRSGSSSGSRTSLSRSNRDAGSSRSSSLSRLESAKQTTSARSSRSSISRTTPSRSSSSAADSRLESRKPASRSSVSAPRGSVSRRTTSTVTPSSRTRVSSSSSRATTSRSTPTVVRTPSSQNRSSSTSTRYSRPTVSSRTSTAGQIYGRPSIVRQSPTTTSRSTSQYNLRTESRKSVAPPARTYSVPSSRSSSANYGNSSNRRSMPSVSSRPSSSSRSTSSRTYRPSPSSSSRSRVTATAPSTSRSRVSSSSSSSGRTRTSSTTSSTSRRRVGPGR